MSLLESGEQCYKKKSKKKSNQRLVSMEGVCVGYDFLVAGHREWGVFTLGVATITLIILQLLFVCFCATKLWAFFYQ